MAVTVGQKKVLLSPKPLHCSAPLGSFACGRKMQNANQHKPQTLIFGPTPFKWWVGPDPHETGQPSLAVGWLDRSQVRHRVKYV